MPTFKDFFKKPSILSSKSGNTLVCHNLSTSITIETLGWGWLSIKAKDEPSWPGIKKYQSLNDRQLLFTVPFDKELQISMVNCFGKSNLIMAPIKANSALHQIVAPQYPIYNKTLINEIKPPKYPSFNKNFLLKNIIKEGYGQPKSTLSTAIQLSKKSLYLTKFKFINNRINLYKPLLMQVKLNHTLKFNPVKISNKISTEFINNY